MKTKQPKKELKVCLAKNCSNIPGPDFLSSGYCGKHQANAKTNKTLNRSEFKTKKAESAITMEDFLEQDDPWKTISDLLNVSEPSLLVEYNLWGPDKMNAHYNDDTLTKQVASVDPKRVSQVISSISGALDENESYFTERASNNNRSKSSVTIGDDYWQEHEGDLSLPIVAWELSQMNTPDAIKLAKKLATIVEAHDKDDLTVFELSVLNGQTWYHRVDERNVALV